MIDFVAREREREELTIERRCRVLAPGYFSGGGHAAVDNVLHASIGSGVEDDFANVNLSQTTRLIESLPKESSCKSKGP